MVLQLFIGLLAIAAASLLITQGRRRRIWSVLILAGLCVVSYYLLDNLSQSANGGFIYQWLPYKELKADFNISSSQNMRQMFLPLICLLAAVVYLNTVSASEEHSLHFNTLMLFNFISLILQASSHDFLQLMFAGAMLSVISFYMPDLAVSKKRLFVFNFLAEMAVFMAFAIVYGKTHSISLSVLPKYAHNGWHKDLVAGLLMFAIGCKCGLFLLNGHYLSFKDIIFNRTVAIMSLSVPLSGLVLTAKVYPLLHASKVAETLFPVWLGISVAAAVAGALCNNHLKSKAIALSLGVYAALLLWIYGDKAALYNVIPFVLVFNFLILYIFVLAFNAASEETSVWRLGGFWKLTKVNFVLSLLTVASVSAGAAAWSDSEEFYWALGYLVITVVILRMVYWGKTRALEKVASFAKDAGAFYIVPLAVVCLCFVWQTHCWNNPSYIKLLLALSAVFCLFPVKWLMRVGNLKIWQTRSEDVV